MKKSNCDKITECLKTSLVGKKIYVSTPEGHGIGGPIEKATVDCLRLTYPKKVYTPDGLWNQYVSTRPHIKGEDRLKAVDPVSRHLLTIRKNVIVKEETDGITNKILPSQTATADFITFDHNAKWEEVKKLIIGDVKSIDADGSTSGSNNLVSYTKIRKMCEIMREHDLYHKIDFLYVGVQWRILRGDHVLVVDVSTYDLFDEDPKTIRLNRRQGQMQSSVSSWTQDYGKSRQKWCEDFLDHLASWETIWKKKGTV